VIKSSPSAGKDFKRAIYSKRKKASNQSSQMRGFNLVLPIGVIVAAGEGPNFIHATFNLQNSNAAPGPQLKFINLLRILWIEKKWK